MPLKNRAKTGHYPLKINSIKKYILKKECEINI